MNVIQFSHSAAVLSTLAALSTAPAFGASVSYFLDQSNINAAPYLDGQNFLQATVSDGVGGAIDFLVKTLAPLSGNAGSNYGIQSVGFNTILANVTAANITNLPAGWSVSTGQNQDGFGNFQFVVDTTGTGRVDPLSFSITGIAGDTPSDYVALSSGNAGEGNMAFAAHVAGLSTQTTSGFFGGPTALVPESDTWSMMLVGVGLLGLQLRRRIRRTRHISA